MPYLNNLHTRSTGQKTNRIPQKQPMTVPKSSHIIEIENKEWCQILLRQIVQYKQHQRHILGQTLCPYHPSSKHQKTLPAKEESENITNKQWKECLSQLDVNQGPALRKKGHCLSVWNFKPRLYVTEIGVWPIIVPHNFDQCRSKTWTSPEGLLPFRIWTWESVS